MLFSVFIRFPLFISSSLRRSTFYEPNICFSFFFPPSIPFKHSIYFDTIQFDGLADSAYFFLCLSPHFFSFPFFSDAVSFLEVDSFLPERRFFWGTFFGVPSRDDPLSDDICFFQLAENARFCFNFPMTTFAR